MFTGLIEKVTKVDNITLNSMGAKISFQTDFDNVKVGDSIAINGVCLTMTSINNNIFCADVMKETLNLTNLKHLKTGDEINLERAMKADGRYGGHMVYGHVDGLGKILNIQKNGEFYDIKWAYENGWITMENIAQAHETYRTGKGEEYR